MIMFHYTIVNQQLDTYIIIPERPAQDGKYM